MTESGWILAEACRPLAWDPWKDKNLIPGFFPRDLGIVLCIAPDLVEVKGVQGLGMQK